MVSQGTTVSSLNHSQKGEGTAGHKMPFLGIRRNGRLCGNAACTTPLPGLERTMTDLPDIARPQLGLAKSELCSVWTKVTEGDHYSWSFWCVVSRSAGQPLSPFVMIATVITVFGVTWKDLKSNSSTTVAVSQLDLPDCSGQPAGKVVSQLYHQG